jgi:hypothetical protein
MERDESLNPFISIIIINIKDSRRITTILSHNIRGQNELLLWLRTLLTVSTIFIFFTTFLPFMILLMRSAVKSLVSWVYLSCVLSLLLASSEKLQCRLPHGSRLGQALSSLRE